MDAKIKVFNSKQETADALASKIYQLASNSKEEIHIALSGGSTPAILFDILADKYASTINWNKIHFWWGDERCVAPDNKESNYGMTKMHLLSKISIPEENVHRIKGELAPSDACALYIKELEASIPLQDNIPVFDLIILGMGDDGHTASIFPHQLSLIDSPDLCVVATHPSSGQKRVSFTGKLINAAKEICFLIAGDDKALPVMHVLEQKEDYLKLPSSYVKPTSGQVYFYLDKAAAKLLHAI